MCQTPFVVSLGRRTADLSASNHERPFDKLRANGENPIFVTMTVRLIRQACYSAVCLQGVPTIIIVVGLIWRKRDPK